MNYRFASDASKKVTMLDKKNGNKIGDLEITPVSIRWRPSVKGVSKSYSIHLDQFIEWITTTPLAKRVNS